MFGFAILFYYMWINLFSFLFPASSSRRRGKHAFLLVLFPWVLQNPQLWQILLCSSFWLPSSLSSVDLWTAAITAASEPVTWLLNWAFDYGPAAPIPSCCTFNSIIVLNEIALLCQNWRLCLLSPFWAAEHSACWLLRPGQSPVLHWRRVAPDSINWICIWAKVISKHLADSQHSQAACLFQECTRWICLNWWDII